MCLPTSDPYFRQNIARFVNVMLGLEWIKDNDTQIFITDFLDNLCNFRNSLLLSMECQNLQV